MSAGSSETSAGRQSKGPGFAGRDLDKSAYLDDVKLDFSRPGKPTDNADIDAFNGRLRAECLNASWFLSMADARDQIEHRKSEYDRRRPQLAPGQLDAPGRRRPNSGCQCTCIGP